MFLESLLALVLIHSDSTARQDARDNFFFLVSKSERREEEGTQVAGPPPMRKFRMSPSFFLCLIARP